MVKEHVETENYTGARYQHDPIVVDYHSYNGGQQ